MDKQIFYEKKFNGCEGIRQKSDKKISLVTFDKIMFDQNARNKLWEKFYLAKQCNQANRQLSVWKAFDTQINWHKIFGKKFW